MIFSYYKSFLKILFFHKYFRPFSFIKYSRLKSIFLNISDRISSVKYFGSYFISCFGFFLSFLDTEGDGDDEIGPKLDEAVKGDNSEGREPVKHEAPVKQEPVLLTRDENLRNHRTQREWDKEKESKR